jgi:uncharacterized protein DUF4410
MMRIRTFLREFATPVCLGFTVFGAAQAADTGPKLPIYIEDFKAEMAQSDSSSGLFSHLGATRRAAKVEKNATALADALVRELNAEGMTAYRVSGQDSAPRTGWLIKGVFSETVPRGGLLSSLGASSGSSAPNTEVTLSITDLAADSAKPVAMINTPASLTGQGSSISFNPYVVAAKIVVHKVQSGRSIDDLAKRVATQIVAQRA